LREELTQIVRRLSVAMELVTASLAEVSPSPRPRPSPVSPAAIGRHGVPVVEQRSATLDNLMEPARPHAGCQCH
jgi:hypothetical protein